MTEENKVETTPETPPVEESNPIEERAREMGWRPKEEWEGDEADWRDAKEYVDRKPLYDRIDALNRRTRDMDRAIRTMQEHHAKVEQAAYKRALDDLKAQKKAALEDGDTDKLLEIDEQITDLKVEEKTATKQPTQPHPALIDWVQRNPWYANDPSLRSSADMVAFTIANENPGIDPLELLEETGRRIKRTFKDKFTNPNKTKPSAVEGASNSGASKASASKYSLTDDESRVMKSLVRAGVMTEAEYIADLKKIKGE